MTRIVIIGTTGVGKSTLAEKIALTYGLNLIDLDLINFLPHWVERSDEEFLNILSEKIKAKDWVVAGNFSKSRALTWENADYLIWLDYGFFRNFWQISARTFTRVVTGKEILNGNKETFQKVFSQDSILLWFFKTYRKNRKRYKLIFSDPRVYPHLRYIHLTSPKETNQWFQIFNPSQE